MRFCCLNLFALVRTGCRVAVRSGLAVGAALLLGWFAMPARADVWGYIDAKDVAHFASSRLDERYELFFRGGESFAVGRGEQALATPSAASAPSARVLSAPPRLLAFFDVSPNYKAVKHLLKDASTSHGVDYELLQALIATESGFDTHAVSPKGAVGLMQLIPPTAQRYGVKPGKEASIEKKLTDPKTNIQAGTRYLRDLINLFPGQLELALAAYNAGEGAVQRAGNKIPNYPETQNYVKTVLQLYNHLKPPVAVLEARRSAGRVRMEMMGGAAGRGNMVPPLTEQPAAAVLPPEPKARQN
ncbi:MAG: lytic transglycosylase domain-containing protein [Polaromonas sp.]|nr:MAG: lytic transglycosylase domain-containing protein [Polaromonas sp.]